MSIKLMTLVWDDTRFCGDELLILLCLADHANDEGVCWPSYDRVAARCRCTRRHAMRCIERLRKEGWITKEARQTPDGRQSSNLFRLNMGGVTWCHPTSHTLRGDIQAPRGVTFEAGGVTPMSPESSLNRHEPPLGSSEPEMADLNQPF